MRFLSIGECMGELSPTDGVGTYALRFAGDTYNTAWYLRRLRPDAGVAYLTAIGRDEMSDRMHTAFTEAGIDTRFVTLRADRSIGLYLITLRDGERSFTYWRSAAAARRLADDPAALAPALAWADTAYLSGITMAILEGEGRAHLLGALAAARATGTRVVFDTNLRPRLWASPEEARDVIMQAAAVADMVLPSFDEEAAAFGDDSPAATAARYGAAGATTVVVKNGAGPIWLHAPGLDAAQPVPPASQVIDTTAAGDSFNAALLDALDRGATLPDAALAAAALARRVIAAPGALVAPDPRS